MSGIHGPPEDIEDSEGQRYYSGPNDPEPDYQLCVSAVQKCHAVIEEIIDIYRCYQGGAFGPPGAEARLMKLSDHESFQAVQTLEANATILPRATPSNWSDREAQDLLGDVQFAIILLIALRVDVEKALVAVREGYMFDHPGDMSFNCVRDATRPRFRMSRDASASSSATMTRHARSAA